MTFTIKAARRACNSFIGSENGTLTFLMLPMFVLFIFGTGLAIDFARHEAERIDLQDALDRGVLAAASAATNDEAKAVVQQFVDARTFNRVPVQANVIAQLQGGPGTERIVSATAGYQMPTAFLYLVGLPTVGVNSAAAAIEQEPVDGEIALILDISGSMAREATSGTAQRRLGLLQDAASEFVSDILNSPGGVSTSITLVPYAGHVNPGQFFYEKLIDPAREFDGLVKQVDPIFADATFAGFGSHCIEFTDADFDLTDPTLALGLPPEGARSQVPHFQNFSYERLRDNPTGDPNAGRNAEWGWCPTDVEKNDLTNGFDETMIVPFTDDVDLLTKHIRGFHGHDGTGTQIGFKWGLAMLAPSTQPYIQELSEMTQLERDAMRATEVPVRFADRPKPYDANNTVKTIVLMTDGNVRYQVRPLLASYDTELFEDGPEEFGFRPECVAAGSTGGTAYNTLTSGFTPSSVQEQAGENCHKFFESNLASQSARDADELVRFNQLQDLCALAKSNGITIYTIGFDIEAGTPADTAMSNCATGPEFYFDVDGSQLFDAFDKISVDLQALKLFR
ncbi:MAG: pilus assembly protein TadG-related protein [Pseudomonadota bacterium]